MRTQILLSMTWIYFKSYCFTNKRKGPAFTFYRQILSVFFTKKENHYVKLHRTLWVTVSDYPYPICQTRWIQNTLNRCIMPIYKTNMLKCTLQKGSIEFVREYRINNKYRARRKTKIQQILKSFAI